MPDYGHPIRFGTFVTPVNAPADRAVRLAQLSEALGYDLVTFQDHPYNAGFHDTWTLLTWVAAQTERIEISGNVLNLPLRPPAVLARSAASLDLLSGGRFALGLGAGGFYGPIEAMGGPALTAGEAVTGLDEAIDIIRGIWDAGERRPLRVDGVRYRVDGAKRGPEPAHRIPIWLGALKPRMLRLIGRKADGWLPSLPYLQPGDLQRGNATIDEAAAAAGRDPREITRLLNIGPDQSAAQIVRLAIEDGISTFIVMGDDAGTLQRFAEETMPAVREGVRSERGRAGTSEAPVRPASALAARLPGIDYEGVPASLRATAIEPGDFGYRTASANYLRGGSPGLILRPGSAEEVRAAIGYAAAHREVPLGIRSAGHGVSGRSTNDGGLVVDLARRNEVTLLDREERLVRIGPGARWVEVARALVPHGLAITSGDYGGVGVGGLATAGGIGFLARKHGLTIDHLVAAELVLADGSIVRASASEEPELFWAVRGAGANFGVVTSFEFRAAEVGRLGFAQLVYAADDVVDFIERWGATMEAAPRDVSGEFILGAPRGGRSVAQSFLVVDRDEPEAVLEALQPFAAVAPLADQAVQLVGYDELMGAFFTDAPHAGWGEPVSRSGMLDHLSADFAAESAELLASGVSHFFQIRAVGGAVADVPAEATAYAHRAANFSLAAMGSRATRLDTEWARLEPYFDGLYLSFDTRTDPEVVGKAFPPAHLTRLRALKRALDPTGLFRDNFFIDPA